MMAMGCIVTWVLPLRCLLILLPNSMHVYANIIYYNAIVFISRQEGSIATVILPTHRTPLSSLPVGRNEVMISSDDNLY